MASVAILERELRVDKLGIMQLSAILKRQGHGVYLAQDIAQTKNCDAILCSVMTGEHEWYMDAARNIRSDARIIFGGPHATFFPEQFEAIPEIDHIVIGPGEHVIAPLVAGELTDRIVKSRLLSSEEMDALPFADRSIQYSLPEFKDADTRRFIASRDCRNACSYCFNHVYHRVFRDDKSCFFARQSPRRLVDEIEYVRDVYGCRIVYFNDDNLAEDAAWLAEMLALYARDVGLPFCGSVRADYADGNTLAAMADAGCTFLNVALESSNESTQKLLRRGRTSNGMIATFVDNCKRLGIKTRVQNMIGLPVEDPLGDALDTLEFNQRLAPFDAWASIFQPLPKTDAWQLCADAGLVDESTQCKNFYEETQLKIADAAKINSLHKWWFWAVRHMMPRALVEVLLDVELTREQAAAMQALRWETSRRELYSA